MSQSNINNPTAPVEPGSSAEQNLNGARSKARRVVWILAIVAFSLYFGSIAWFYLTRGAA